MKLTAAPGIIIAQEVKEETQGIITETKQTRVLKGKVISLGKPHQSTYSTRIIDPKEFCKLDDIVYFLSYEGNYDVVRIEGVNYFLFKAEDLRAIER